MPSFIWSSGRRGFLGVRVFSIWNGSFAVGDTSIREFGRALVAINCPIRLFETMKVQYLSEECSSSYHLFSGARLPPTFRLSEPSSMCCETLSGSFGYMPRSIHEHSPGARPSPAGLVPRTNVNPMFLSPDTMPITKLPPPRQTSG